MQLLNLLCYIRPNGTITEKETEISNMACHMVS